jgi:hypothetical protein
MSILQFKTWLEDAGATGGNDYSNSGGAYEDKIDSSNTAKSNPTEPNDDIEKKNREEADNNLKKFGGVSDLLRMKKMKKMKKS